LSDDICKLNTNSVKVNNIDFSPGMTGFKIGTYILIMGTVQIFKPGIDLIKLIFIILFCRRMVVDCNMKWNLDIYRISNARV